MAQLLLDGKNRFDIYCLFLLQAYFNTTFEERVSKNIFLFSWVDTKKTDIFSRNDDLKWFYTITQYTDMTVKLSLGPSNAIICNMFCKPFCLLFKSNWMLVNNRFTTLNVFCCLIFLYRNILTSWRFELALKGQQMYGIPLHTFCTFYWKTKL